MSLENYNISNKSPFKPTYSHRVSGINQNQLSSPQNRQKTMSRESQIQKRNLVESFYALQGTSFDSNKAKQYAL